MSDAARPALGDQMENEDFDLRGYELIFALT